MSESLIHTTMLLSTLNAFFSILLLIGGVGFLIYVLVMWYLEKKKDYFLQLKRNDRNKYDRMSMDIIESNNYTSEEKKEKQKNIDEEHEGNQEVYGKSYDKYRKRAEFVEEIGKPLGYVVVFMLSFTFLAYLLFAIGIGGNVNNIKPIEYNDESAYASAYYVVDYEKMEQVTLTVFVRNNSNKVLKSATLNEGNTSSSVQVENIEPGQEKLVSLTVYPLKDDNYKFELTNVEFYE